MKIEKLTIQDLLSVVQDLKTAGYRLCQICATTVDMQGHHQRNFDFRLGRIFAPPADQIEILYTFEKDNELKNLKITTGATIPELQSITPIYGYAFIYENEIHDLFGVAFKNLTPDYGGNFYRISAERPWNPDKRKGGDSNG